MHWRMDHNDIEKAKLISQYFFISKIDFKQTFVLEWLIQFHNLFGNENGEFVHLMQEWQYKII